MKNITKTEMTLIRSKALVALFGMLLGALLLLPVFTMAKDGKKPESKAILNMHAFQANKMAAISINSLEEGRYTLTLEDNTKEHIYYDKVVESPENFAKIFDLSALDDGSYTLRVESRKDSKTRDFEIVNGKIKVYYEDPTVPVFKAQGDKAILELSNSNELNYSIRVINEEGIELTSESKTDKDIKKLFDFSDAQSGNYTIVASSSRTSYTFDYTK